MLQICWSVSHIAGVLLIVESGLHKMNLNVFREVILGIEQSNSAPSVGLG